MAIYFIRHGQSLFNAAYDGEQDPMIFDPPLTKLGEEQAARARRQIEDLGIKRVISSPLRRAIQTAQIMFDGIVPIDVRHGHHELLLHSGDVGSDVSALKAAFPELEFDHLPRRWWHHETGALDEITPEPLPVFQERMSSFVENLAEITDRPVAIVGHGNAFREITGLQFENCQIHRYK
ncbi:MAG: histidine phosphatase family protein [Stappiaceae bacterium]